jgi:hypothetical protein
VALPPLDGAGLLPDGIHDATLAEVTAQFGQFQRSDKRQVLVRSLGNFLREATDAEIIDHLILDGSFVTSKEEPGDIDFIVVLRPGVLAAGAPVLRPDQENVISYIRVKKRHKFDILVAHNEELLLEYTNFYREVKEVPGTVKGLIRVKVHDQ